MTKRDAATERSAATGTAGFTISTSSGRASLPMLATRNEEGNVAGRRAQEDDAALDAEDVLTQAEETNALDPVG